MEITQPLNVAWIEMIDASFYHMELNYTKKKYLKKIKTHAGLTYRGDW